MRAKRAKKAFTIVELVIVIAVIAILMAVLIPTFVSLVKKANVSSDSQLVRNLNTILTAEEVSEGKNPTMHDALTDAIENGYDITKINPASEDNDIVWNQNTDRFELCAKDGGAVHLWKIADEYSAEEGYSIYLRTATASASTASRMPVASAEETNTTTITARTGIDVGDRSDISVIYENSTSTAKVVIRTNGGALTIKQAGGDVVRYGYVAQLSVESVTGTYYEGGFVGMLVECDANEFVALSSAVFHQDRAMIVATLGTTSATLDGATYASHYYGENDRCNDCKVLRPGHVHTWKVTETETGTALTLTYICTVCEERYTKTIDKPTEEPGHVHNVARHIDAKKPTCTEAGNQEYWVCSCGKFFADENATKEIDDPTSVILPPKGHTAGAPKTVTVAATCATAGSSTITVSCTVCEAILSTKTSSIPATGAHSYDATTHQCTSCGQADPDYNPISEKVTDGVLSANAFKNNTEITTAVIPEDVTSIGVNAFNGCTNLTSVTIPSTVTSIGANAFQGCSALTSVTIPEGVTTIGSAAFQGCSLLKNVTIPSTVTSIGERAFYNCTTLTSATIKEDVTSIGASMFQGCSALTSVDIPSSVTTIGSAAFSGCKTLESVTIPSGVTTIERSAFYNCSALTSVTIPDAVTAIENQTFANCAALTTIQLGTGVSGIDGTAFEGVGELTTITVKGGNSTYHSDGNCLIKTKAKELVLGGKSAVIPTDGSVLSIGQMAFKGRTALTTIIIPNRINSIGASAFYNTGLTSVSIPESVTTIGEIAFSSCAELTEVDLSALSDATSIADQVFATCATLTTVTLSNAMTVIPTAMFKGCTALASITIPDSVTTIEESAFRSCSALTSIKIPANVTSIEQFVFDGCDNLTSATVEGTSTWTCSYTDYSAFPAKTKTTTITFGNNAAQDAIYLKGSQNYPNPSFTR